VLSPLVYSLAVSRARRRRGEIGELAARRRGHDLLWLEHAAFFVLVVSGLVLVELSGARLQSRWLSLKVGLVAFLLAPLEAMHAYVAQAWIGPGLRRTAAPPLAKELVRGVSAQQMILTIATPLLGLALPVLVWLSWARPR